MIYNNNEINYDKKRPIYFENLYLFSYCSVVVNPLLFFIMTNITLITESEKMKYLSEFYAGLVIVLMYSVIFPFSLKLPLEVTKIFFP